MTVVLFGGRGQQTAFQRAPAPPTTPSKVGGPFRGGQTTPAPAQAETSNTTWVDHSFDQRSADEALRPGAKVRHARYGVGEVVSVQPGDTSSVPGRIEVRRSGLGAGFELVFPFAPKGHLSRVGVRRQRNTGCTRALDFSGTRGYTLG